MTSVTPRHELEVIGGPNEGRRIAFDDQLVVGRTGEGAGFFPDDPDLSRRHARLLEDASGALLVEDLASSNGTWRNGVRIVGPERVSVGDQIRVGRTVLRVVSEQGARTAWSPRPAGESETRARAMPADARTAIRARSGFGAVGWLPDQLQVVSGRGAGRRLRVVGDELLLGRTVEGEGSLADDAEASRQHARVRVSESGGLLIEDLASANGTLVNGERLPSGEHPLVPGDTVRLGQTVLLVTDPAGDLPAATVIAGRPPEPPVSARVGERLEVVAGPGAGRRLAFGEQLVLGRSVRGEGRLAEDVEVSRRHARVVRGGDGLTVQDLRSGNGTWRNGHRVEGVEPLVPGDRLQVGQTTLVLTDPFGQVPAPAAAPPRLRPAARPRREGGLLGALAVVVHRRWRLVLVLVAVFVAVAGVFGGNVAKVLSAGNDFNDPASSSVVAGDRLAKARGSEPAPGVIALVTAARGTIANPTPATKREVQRVAGILGRDPAVARTLTYYDTRSSQFLSDDGRSTDVVAFLKPDVDEQRLSTRLHNELGSEPGVRVGGSALAGPAIGEQSEKDLRMAEAIALPLLLLASLYVFRGVVAALLPVFVGVVTVLGTFLGLKLVNQVQTQSIFALNMVVGLGLGLAIDYSLFMLTRYREELAASGPGLAPLVRTLNTAGRTILFSAATVSAALVSLTVFPQRFLRSMGIGGLICTLIAAATALIALSALLAALGPRVNALAPQSWQRAADRAARGQDTGFWYRLSHFVMRRPALIAIVSGAFLVAAGLPFLRVQFTGVDASVLPTSSAVRQVDDTLKQHFSHNPASPISLAVEAPANAGERLQAYANDLRALPGVNAVSAPVLLSDRLWQINVTPAHGSFDDRTQRLVDRIRGGPAPFPVQATGDAPMFADQQASLAAHLPLSLAILICGTLVALFLLTGSVVIPIKSVLINFLSLSATFGLLVLIFQDGWLEGPLAFKSQGALNATQPILLFIIAFGLSTDYGVFLLTRIKEQHDAGMPNREAVAVGLQRTGRIITAAALLFSLALGAFATSQIIFIKLLGVGAVLAVLIDSSIVRALLVPSLMAMLGTRNWWAPKPLRRLHARIGLSEA